LQIAIDKNIPLAESAFKGLGEVALLETTDFSSTAVKSADILVVRSETRVDRTLLEESRVRFVGTATIGTDHIDIPYLQSKGIGFASAPGSNANSVKEYVLAAMLTLGARRGFALAGRAIGVVGVGNIGSKVAKMAGDLGMTVLLNDPPLARMTGDPKFVPLDKLMETDIISLHVPLTRTGGDPTFHLFDNRRIAAMKKGSILINTSRGGVVDTAVLKNALGRGDLSTAAVDVWEGEPSIDVELLKLVGLATSHIAGYSLDGKVNAVRIIREAVCGFLKNASPWDPLRELPPADPAEISLDARGTMDQVLRTAVLQCYDIEFDDRNLREMLDVPFESRSSYYMKLRTGYRVRREFFNTRVVVPHGLESVGKVLEAVGFRQELREGKAN
jgi:erythronate-4-phosphate dehydrogenase